MNIGSIEELQKVLVNVLAVVKKDGNYPESETVLKHWIDAEGEINTDHLEVGMFIANDLHDTDATLPMHPSVAELVTTIYKAAIEAENFDAACDLGSLYYTGRAGEQSYEKAAHYYGIADKNGNKQATENLGYIYYYGRIGARDYEKAFKYFIKGALDNHLRSLYKVGDFYKNGYFVEKDEKEAFRIYQQCAEMLSDESVPQVGADIFMRLGDCFFEGCGTERDLLAANRCLTTAENMFYERLMEGDFYQQRNLEHVLEREAEIKKLIKKEMLPNMSWAGYNE